jgi:hypothetical protein
MMAKYYTALLNKLRGKLTAFKRNLVSSRQCCSSLDSHYGPEIGRFTLKLRNTQPTHLIWPLWTTSSFLTSREEKFLALSQATLATDGWFAAPCSHVLEERQDNE